MTLRSNEGNTVQQRRCAATKATLCGDDNDEATPCGGDNGEGNPCSGGDDSEGNPCSGGDDSNDSEGGQS
jgi:hypothetical protein